VAGSRVSAEVSAEDRLLDAWYTRRKHWFLWPSAALTCLSLIFIPISTLTLGRQIHDHRTMIAEVLVPAHEKLTELQATFGTEVAALLSHSAVPDQGALTRLRAALASEMMTVAGLGLLAARLGPGGGREFSELRELLERWRVAPSAAASGLLSPEELRRRIAEHEALVRPVFEKALRLEAIVALRTQNLLNEMRLAERRRMVILSGLSTLALVSALLTAFFASRTHTLNRRLARRTEEEVLLRDAAAALTGAEVLPEALDRVAAAGMGLGEADAAFVARPDDAGLVEVVGRAGEGAPPLGTRASYSGSITEHVVRTGKHHVVVDFGGADHEIGRIVAERCGPCSGLAVPLGQDGEVVGALVLIHKVGHSAATPEEVLGRMRVLGALTALSLRRDRLVTAVEAERSRLEAVIEQMPVGVVMAEAPSGRVVFSNQKASEIWGKPAALADRMAEYSQYEGFHPNGRPYEAHEWPMARSLRTGERVDGEEVDIVTFEGARRVVRLSSAPILDSSGRVVAAVSTMFDITKRRRLEEASAFLDEASRLLASSFDYNATLLATARLTVRRVVDYCAVHLVSKDGKTIRRVALVTSDAEANGSAQEFEERHPIDIDAAHPAAEVIRSGKSQLMPEVTDEILEQIARESGEIELLRRLELHSGMAAPLVVRGKTLGSLLLLSKAPAWNYTSEDIALAEELARRAALAVDNAELFAAVSDAERRAWFLAEAAQTLSFSLEYAETLHHVVRLAVPFFADCTVAYVVNQKGVIQQVEVAHRDPAKEPLIEEAGQIYRPGPENEASTIMRAVRSGEAVLIDDVTPELVDSFGFEPKVRETFDEILAPVSWIAVPLVARGETLGAVLFISSESGRRYGPDDVSLAQQLASRAALAVQNAMLFENVHEALRTRDEVLAIVSHDLRNPLNTIAMTSQFLLETPCDAVRLKKHLAVIRRAEERMDRLIQDLLDVARIEAGKSLSIQERLEQPQELVREAHEAFAAQAREKGIRFEYRAAPGLPLVSVDRGRILQVLSNLIGNAVKFTPRGGRVEVSASAVDGEVQVSVRDTGPGIAPQERERIFLPFWQAKRATRTGAGLGLAISRGIIEQHGGRIWVDSEVDHGTVVSFSLPTEHS
jgi:PAS domain S-box-containing protein